MTADSPSPAKLSDEQIAEIAREFSDAQRYDGNLRFWAARHAVSVLSHALAASAALAEITKERDEALDWSTTVDSHRLDQFDDLADAWLTLKPIERMYNAVCSVFSEWANDELMVRFKGSLRAITHQAFVEGCIVGTHASQATIARQAAELAGLKEAVEDFLHAYRQKYARTIGGIRSNAPLREDAKRLVAALGNAEAQG